MNTSRLLLIAAAAAVPTGCRNPFVTWPEEYGRIADPAALSSASPLDLRAKTAATPAAAPCASPDLNTGARPMEASIEQCRAWTLANNLDLKVSMIDPAIADTVVSEEEARFEAAFVAQGSLSDAEPGQAEVFRDQFVLPWDVNPGIDLPLRSGGLARLALPMSRRQTFPNFFDDDLYASDIDLVLEQPLLRGAGRAANTHPIRIAALDSQIAQARTKLEVIRMIAAVDRAYWLLYEADQNLQVRQEQLERACKQRDEAEARAEGGVGPRIEVVRASAGVSRRVESNIRAWLLVKDRQRGLKRIVNVAGADVESETVLVLTSAPEAVRYEIDQKELIDLSMAERIELLELELELAKTMSTIDFAQNQALPLFVLDYVYRFHGTGGSFGEAWEHGGTQSGWGWRVGVDVEIPIGNEAAESRVQRAILERLQRLSSRAAREQAVKAEVLASLDNLESAWQRILAARQNVNAEQLNYEAEQGQFLLGLRNSTEVLDAENRLAEARIADISARVDYQVAQIDLAFATGTLLGAARVSW